MNTGIKVDRYYKITIHNKSVYRGCYDAGDDWSISGIGLSISEAIENAFSESYRNNHIERFLSRICSLDFDYSEVDYMSGITYNGVTYYSDDLSGVSEFEKYETIPSTDNLSKMVRWSLSFHHLLDLYTRYTRIKIYMDRRSKSLDSLVSEYEGM